MHTHGCHILFKDCVTRTQRGVNFTPVGANCTFNKNKLNSCGKKIHTVQN